jgi:hypothetical protein
MLRFDFLAEAAFAFAGAATLTAILLSAWVATERVSAAAALALGAAVGVVFHGLLAPTLDYALGRGRLLALTPLAGALFPLAAGAALATGDVFALLAAAALWAFGASLAPQRFALLFDLAPSRGRLRAAADMHGAKLGAAAVAPAAYWSLEGLSAGSGLLIASVVCLAAFALFAPTLGGLGRRQK